MYPNLQKPNNSRYPRLTINHPNDSAVSLPTSLPPNNEDLEMATTDDNDLKIKPKLRNRKLKSYQQGWQSFDEKGYIGTCFCNPRT